MPTWQGWLALVLAFTALLLFSIRGIHPFLAVNNPVDGGALVVEGWLPDYALQGAITEFSKGHYHRVFVTGGPLDNGAPLSEYRTYAELGAATLLHLGLNSNVVQAVPAPRVRLDRTYASAVALKDWLQKQGATETNINLVSLGAHARRSRLLFERAMGGEYCVGIIALENQEYEPNQWWRSSAGVQTVIDQTIAYLYARLSF